MKNIVESEENKDSALQLISYFTVGVKQVKLLFRVRKDSPAIS